MALSRGNAVLVSLAVPGLAHAILGRPLRGAIAFVVTAGAFAVGYTMLQERLWHLQAIPLGGLFRYFPVLLLPEFANFGPTVLVASIREADTQELLRRVQLPRDGEDLAMLLTGFSGILSVLWACDAWWTAEQRRARGISPPVAAAVTWMLPGAGHLLAGQRGKGLLLGAAVLVMFVAGLAFGAGHSVDRAASPFWWAGQAFCGIGTVFATFVTAPTKMAAYPEMRDLGIILCTIAGLMNMMVMTDAYSVAERGSEVPAEAPA